VDLCCFRGLHDFCIASCNVTVAYIAHNRVVEQRSL
jgi:hypothetical protein